VIRQDVDDDAAPDRWVEPDDPDPGIGQLVHGERVSRRPNDTPRSSEATRTGRSRSAARAGSASPADGTGWTFEWT